VRAIGVITTAVVAAGAAYGVALVVRSLPDIRRYLKIRSM